MRQIKSNTDQACRSGGAVISVAAETRRPPMAAHDHWRTHKPLRMTSLRQTRLQPAWNDILTKKHRGWGSVPSSNPARSGSVGRASKLESPVREEVLERFLLGFEGTALPDWLANLLSAGLAGVAIYPRNYADPADLLALTTAIRTAAGRPV